MTIIVQEAEHLSAIERLTREIESLDAKGMRHWSPDEARTVKALTKQRAQHREALRKLYDDEV